jgi:hypothetical protein
MASTFKGPELSPSSEDIRTQIALILASPAFQGSRRCRQFLEYVCEKSLGGELGSLKERAIAIEVFGRRPQSDFADDTIVRVGAREVRKRLALYYGTAEGAAAKIRVDLPSGCYAPEFRYPEPPAVEPLALAPTPEPPVTPVPAPRSPLLLWYGAAAILAVLGVAFLAGYFPRIAPPPTTASFERFWGPVIAAREPLLLAVGHPLVYHASNRALKLNDERLPALPYPVQRPLKLAPNELTGSDLIPVLNQYVGFGDMVVATEVAAMLGRRSKETLVRMASTVPFADLRQSPTLLIGAITNRWTMELGQTWRFRFDRQDRGNLIVDTAGSPPGSRVWAVPHREDGAAQEDYLLISRMPRSSIGKLLIVAAGIKQFGTEAAGHLLSEPVALDSVLSKMPTGWADKNLQVVLKVQVIGNTPATPEIVAWHTW